MKNKLFSLQSRDCPGTTVWVTAANKGKKADFPTVSSLASPIHPEQKIGDEPQLLDTRSTHPSCSLKL